MSSGNARIRARASLGQPLRIAMQAGLGDDVWVNVFGELQRDGTCATIAAFGEPQSVVTPGAAAIYWLLYPDRVRGARCPED